MLPIPFKNFIPEYFKSNLNAAGIAMCSKIDSYFLALLDEIKKIEWLIDVERCPIIFLDVLGYTLNAGLKQTDSEITKRQKIYKAIETHKIRGSWNNHAKILIDAITGYDARIYRGYDSDDSIECGDGVVEIGTDWGVEGTPGSNPAGELEIGDGTEFEIQGNIYIDCHYGIFTPVLTASQIAQIVDNLTYDVVPAYMRIYLGYVDGSSIFQIYSGGIIA